VTPYAQATNAYAPAKEAVRTDRGLEYEALAKTTSAIRRANALGRDGFNALVSALHDNQKLWTLFAIDVAEGQNRLSPEIRAQIFYLAEFTQAHTRKILRKEADASALVEINVAIMRGLAQKRVPQ